MLNRIKTNAAVIFFSSLMLMGNVVAKEQKIGMVDIESIMPQMAAMESILQTRFKSEIEELEQLQTGAKYNYEKLQRNAETMSDTQIEKLRETLLEQKRAMHKKNQSLREAMRNDYEYEKERVLVLISEIITKVAKDGGYDYIIRRENLAYGIDNDNDISAKVLEQAQKN